MDLWRAAQHQLYNGDSGQRRDSDLHADRHGQLEYDGDDLQHSVGDDQRERSRPAEQQRHRDDYRSFLATVEIHGDFNGDGRDNILLYHAASTNLGMWVMNGSTITTGALVGSGVPSVAGVGDSTATAATMC